MSAHPSRSGATPTTHDNKPVSDFYLLEARAEIAALREQKQIAIKALRYAASNIGGLIGETTAGALNRLVENSNG